MNKKTPIRFHYISSCTLENRQRLKKFIQAIFRKENRPLSALTVVFCNDQYLLSLNQKFLDHDFFTDILSFPLSNPGEPLIGEIYISVDRVRENARSYGLAFKEEIHRIIFHGVLHFCGYKDKSRKDKYRMTAAESKFLKNYYS